MTQESHSSISAIVNRQASPLTEDIPFSVSDKVGEDDFDPSAALNISAHSNDPGTDFLSLMESTNEKRASGRRSNSPGYNEFSFSMFGAAADQVPSSGGSGGEFVFDFGNPTQEDDGGGDTSFHFNFDGPSDEQAGGKDEGFNLFGF
ncbi:hypothetical protein OESDEN_25387 [Oesophagostomum dentatum]|uniref:Uncharacterized protein n=1 Tax=Oesophagostomum dentatum TaxID=61180 RepID=A0A0B1RV24_OESDE|nr:hypothetical protein OESDEN_25387 [Oesophagostomum dentatum]